MWIAITVALVGAIVADGWATGAAGVPFDDDWAYLRIVRGLARTGHLHLVGWNDLNLLGLLAIGRVVIVFAGDGISTLRTVSVLSGALALVLFWQLVRRGRNDLRGLAVLGLATMPAFGVLLVTFMSDLPAMAVSLATLTLGLAAFPERRDGRVSIPLLIAASGVGLFALSIREMGGLAPAAILLTAFVLYRHGRRRTIAVAGAFLVAAVIVLVWRRSFGQYGSEITTPFHPKGSIFWLVRGAITLGLGLLPLLVASGHARRWLDGLRRGAGHWWRDTTWLASLAVVAVAAERMHTGDALLTGDDLMRLGPLGNFPLPGQRAPLLASPIWLALQLGGIVGLAILTTEGARACFGSSTATLAGLRTAVSRIRSWWTATPGTQLAMWVYLGGLLLYIAASAFSFQWVADRYLLAPYCVAAYLLVAGKPSAPEYSTSHRRRVLNDAALATVLACLLGITMFIMSSDAHATTVARWRAAADVSARGIDPTKVDGGFEWDGWYYPGIADSKTQTGHPQKFPNGVYAITFPTLHPCVLVSAQQRVPPRAHLVAVRDYREVLGFVHRRVWVYEYDACAPDLRP